jgi:RND family efflux transporter MFP subunit
MKRNTLVAIVVSVLLAAAGGIGWWMASGKGAPDNAPKAAGSGGGGPVTVSTAPVVKRDVPVSVVANGSVVSMQSVDIRAQTTSIVKSIHIAEGRQVAKDELLVTLDARTEEANLRRAEAQVLKTRSDLANADRNYVRQKDLFDKKFISQSALDAVATQLDVLKGQLAVDQAALEASRVALSLTEIRAPFAGRTGSIAVRPGSVVQPNSAPMLSVSQMDPVYVQFALPERELPGVQKALIAGNVPVGITLNSPGAPTIAGKLAFVENSVDAGAGTISMKAVFSNSERLLWPGMFVNVALTTSVIKDALVVPVQAVQTGPERKFLLVLGEAVDNGNKVRVQPVSVEAMQGGLAVVKGVAEGAQVVVEGAQNVRPSSIVREGKPADSKGAGKKGKDGGKDGAPPKKAAEKSP